MRPTTKIFALALLSATALAALPNAASATNGMNPICYGTDNCGMGGAGVALGGNTAGSILNPALAGRNGRELLISVGWLHADVSGQVKDGTAGYANNADKQDSGASDFPDGTIALNWKINDAWAANLAFFPGGGGATDWKNPRTPLGSQSTTDGDHQIRTRYFFIQPTIAYTPPQDKNWTFGIGPVISYQDMKTDSMDPTFKGPSPGPKQSTDDAWGVGVHAGVFWNPMGNDKLSLGASYRSQIYAEGYKNYSNTFGQGSMDMPAQWAVGLSGKPMPKLTLAGDVKHIDWESVASIGGTEPAKGGFGWNSQFVFLVGAAYEVTDKITLRAGYNYGKSPIDDGHVFANFLFPAITEHHITAGGSYKLGERYELGASAYYAPEVTLTNNPSNPETFASVGGHTELNHRQYGAQASVKMKF